MTNTLAHLIIAKITGLKSFILHAPSVVYGHWLLSLNPYLNWMKEVPMS